MRPARALRKAAFVILATGIVGACQTTKRAGPIIDSAHAAQVASTEPSAVMPSEPGVAAFTLRDNEAFSFETSIDPFTYRDIRPAERPPLDTDEAGIWMAADKSEQKVRTAGNRIVDPELERYVGDVICRLSGPYCPDIRYYVMRVPAFNATMSPNGMMHVWTGFLLRVRNEAQLAAVLGHEIGHYLRRHGIQGQQRVQNISDFLTFLNLAVSAAGVPQVMDLANSIGTMTYLAYNRDQEREADLIGVMLLHRAGYDPREASKVWGNLIEEIEAADIGRPSIWMSTHPQDDDRRDYLLAIANELRARAPANEIGVERYRARIAPFLPTLLRDEVDHGDPRSAYAVFDGLKKDGADPALITYFEGELARLKGVVDKNGELDDPDQNVALARYEESIRLGEPPAELYRSLGIVRARMGNVDGARSAWETYLRLKPKASDAAVVRAMLESI